MKFCYFNVQLLPINPKDGFVGKRGYRKLFQKVDEKVRSYWDAQELHKIAYESRGNFHSLKPFHVGDDYAIGLITKFDLIDKVIQPYTDQELFDAKNRPASSLASDFYFYYSFEKHVLAVESKKRLPAVNVLLKIISYMLDDTAKELNKEYVLHVSLMKDFGRLEELKDKAAYFYRAEIKTSFSNSWDSFDDGAAELQAELKEKGVSKSHLVESSGPGGQMSELSSYAQKLLALSMSCGVAVISFWNVETGSREKFHTDKHPLVLEVNELDDDEFLEVGEDELARRIESSISLAQEKSTRSDENEQDYREFAYQVNGDENE